MFWFGWVKLSAPEELRQMAARVEIRSDCTHVVLALRALCDHRRDLDTVAAVEARLASGERVLAEGERPGHVRIAIPVRMKFSGGRTWIGNEQRDIGADAKMAKSRARKRLKLAHAALGLAVPAFAAHRHVVRTAMMPSADYNCFAWAFLAPDIQSAILNGRLSTLAIATLEKLTAIPLNWDVQRRLLGTNYPKADGVVRVPAL